MDYSDIIDSLPYAKPFLFVDEIISISAEALKGRYTFDPNEFFYQGHFKDNPITPGVILTECMAQLGLVCFGLSLLKPEEFSKNSAFALSSTEIDFFKPVYPGETVTVISEKIYFRFHKLKCKVQMLNAKEELVAKGIISGMLTGDRLRE
ncbi:hydroxymyristoyl-ACP dehydratase [Vitellibacter sp. q18]|nr:hydroxymyristoyl-ACP dehydratase [Aequorivita lutea]